MRQAKILPASEQRRLAKLAQGGDRRAADLVIRSVAKAILAEANTHRRVAEVEELFAIGISGVHEALIQRYDSRKPEAVITYCLSTARGLMLNEVQKQMRRDRRDGPLNVRALGVQDPSVPAQFEAMETAQVFFVAHARARHVLQGILDTLPTRQARVARLALLRKPPLSVKAVAVREKMGLQHVSNVVRAVLKTVKAEMQKQGLLHDLS